MEKRDRFYALVRLFGRFWVWFFFRSVDVRHAERVPGAGPVLLCINHPNNLIDSLLVGAVVERKVHYLATAALFRNALVGKFLKACGAIPLHRRQDDPGKMDKNAGAFEATVVTLARGGLVAIYPEGTTHAESRIQRIKTGAARIALDYESRRAGGLGEVLTLIPTGLTFEARKSFGGRVRVSFGEPIPITPYLEVYREDGVKAVDALTTAIQWGMEAQVLHVDRLDRASLVREVEAVYK
ncbi:MAG TPA: lysophospholipid acyltransferase family protein, partial [Methylomirabilota bacterium]|nr:lysophospholipid acyltransferase family protein [Methylomirabilota bacterium]